MKKIFGLVAVLMVLSVQAAMACPMKDGQDGKDSSGSGEGTRISAPVIR